MILPLPLVKAKRRPRPDPGGGATQGGFTVEAVTKDSHSPGTAPRPPDVCSDPVFRSPHCPLQLLPPGFCSCSWSQRDFLKKRSVVTCPLPGSPVVFPRLLLLHGACAGHGTTPPSIQVAKPRACSPSVGAGLPPQTRGTFFQLPGVTLHFFPLQCSYLLLLLLFTSEIWGVPRLQTWSPFPPADLCPR